MRVWKIVIRDACRKPDEIEYGPIKYYKILLMQQGKTDEDVYVDLVGEVNKLKKLGCDPRSILITILIEVENYLTYNKIGDLPTIT